MEFPVWVHESFSYLFHSNHEKSIDTKVTETYSPNMINILQ